MYQDYAGSPSADGSIYVPKQYGGKGGDGGGSTSDLRCTYSPVQTGGLGGMTINPDLKFHHQFPCITTTIKSIIKDVVLRTFQNYTFFIY